MKAYPFVLAYKRKTPTWLFSRRPAVPLYWRATPADFFPFLRKPVSSITRMPPASPRCWVTYACRSSRTPSRIPVCFPQQALDATWTVFAQLLCHLPAVLALHRCQQAFQKTACPLAHLRSSKACPNARLHMGQFLSHLLQQLFFLLCLLFILLCSRHLLHLPEAVYHVLALSVTVVLGEGGKSNAYVPTTII